MTTSRYSPLVVMAFGLLSASVAAQETPPPARPLHLASGRVATLIETIWESGSEGTLGRYRFLVAAIANEALSLAEVEADLLQLCREQAIPAAQVEGRTADQLVISMSAEAIAFGDTRPDVPQYFETFALQDGDCMMVEF